MAAVLTMLAVAVASPAQAPDRAWPAPEAWTGQARTVWVEQPPSDVAALAFQDGLALTAPVADLRVVDDPDADLTVRWVAELQGGDRLGQHALGTPQIDVALGDTRCAQGWVAYDRATVARAVAHELGHAVGLEHQNGTFMAERLPAAYATACRAG